MWCARIWSVIARVAYRTGACWTCEHAWCSNVDCLTIIDCLNSDKCWISCYCGSCTSCLCLEDKNQSCFYNCTRYDVISCNCDGVSCNSGSFSGTDCWCYNLSGCRRIIELNAGDWTDSPSYGGSRYGYRWCHRCLRYGHCLRGITLIHQER